MTDQALAGIGRQTSVEHEHALQDDLLRRIDDENLVPSGAFPTMVETLARLRELPPSVAWFATRYLQACTIHGHSMFPAVTQSTLGIATAEVASTIRCACGTDVPVDHRTTRRNGRLCEVGACPSCRRDLARWDGEPYPRPTLYAPGMM